jgi:hypothetical protein
VAKVIAFVGQTSAHNPQLTHAAGRTSIGKPPSMVNASAGQTAAHHPQPVQRRSSTTAWQRGSTRARRSQGESPCDTLRPVHSPRVKSRKRRRQEPYHIHRPDQRPFAFAGVWETWHGGESPLETCTIITTSANKTMEPLHNRMPVILDAGDFKRWLSPEPQDATVLLELLQPCPDDWLTIDQASIAVNNSRHEGADCLQVATPN